MTARARQRASWFDPTEDEVAWARPSAADRRLAQRILADREDALTQGPDADLVAQTLRRLEPSDLRILELGATDDMLRAAAQRLLALRLARARSRR